MKMTNSEMGIGLHFHVRVWALFKEILAHKEGVLTILNLLVYRHVLETRAT